MNKAEFSREFAQFRKVNTSWKLDNADGIPSPAEIQRAETLLGFSLNKYYIEFTMEYGGGFFGYADVYSLDQTSDFYIVEQNETLMEYHPGYVAISDNGCGDSYVQRIVDGVAQDKIEFWDHETESIMDGESYENIYDFLCKEALSRD